MASNQVNTEALDLLAWLRVTYPEQYGELLALVRSKP